MNDQNRPERRCTDCGVPQRLIRKTVMYPESGLNNVELSNVPVWICANNHEEIEIPAVTELHELLAHMIVRKPAFLNGAEVRFLRKRVGLSAKEFAKRIGITPEHMSRVETDARLKKKRMDLLIRLSVASMLAARDKKPFPADLAPLVEQLESAWDIGAHRLTHNDQAPPDHEWEETAA
jgi:transcriptional regulator with XRE-family HTH domain